MLLASCQIKTLEMFFLNQLEKYFWMKYWIFALKTNLFSDFDQVKTFSVDEKCELYVITATWLAMHFLVLLPLVTSFQDLF